MDNQIHNNFRHNVERIDGCKPFDDAPCSLFSESDLVDMETSGRIDRENQTLTATVQGSSITLPYSSLSDFLDLLILQGFAVGALKSDRLYQVLDIARTAVGISSDNQVHIPASCSQKDLP